MNQNIRSQMRSQLENLWSNETLILSTLALGVGLGSGIGVFLFKRLIAGFTDLSIWTTAALKPLGGWSAALIPALGGLLVGLIVHFFIGEERHHGVAGVMEAVAMGGGRLRYTRIPAKAITAALGIGAGASIGPEDPSVQIGANLGSFIGQKLHMSGERVRVLVAAGAAAGVAAAFNAPIAGVFFALEIILGEIAGGALGTVVIAAVVSAVFIQAVEGPQPAFHVPAYAFQSVAELPLYFGLGLLAGPVSALYVRLLYWIQDVFRAFQAPRLLKPVIAGLIVGLVGLLLPQVKGVGYETIEAILGGQNLGVVLLLALLVAKILLTPVSIGGGFLGGVFAPSLFLGSVLGAAYGLSFDGLLPTLNVNPPAFAMVGMAAVLAGTVHAPLTAILLLFEMTNDYHIILPLMLAVVVSLSISQLLNHDSVYTLGLARKGIRLERGRDLEVLQTIRVAEVMQTEPLTLRAQDSLAQAAETLRENRRHGLPVLDEADRLVGMLTLQDLDQAQGESTSLRVGEVCTRDLVTAFPDESIGEALRRMSPKDIGRLPVVDRNNHRHLVGLLRRSDVIRAYDLALVQRAKLRHHLYQARLDVLQGDGVQVSEVEVQLGAACAGKLVKSVSWPPNSVITSLRRGRRFLVPHGNTQLKAGDVLIVVSDHPVQSDLDALCKSDPSLSM